jgi:hypothetical protein
MPRLLPSDECWSKLRKIQLHKAIYNKRDLRVSHAYGVSLARPAQGVGKLEQGLQALQCVAGLQVNGLYCIGCCAVRIES